MTIDIKLHQIDIPGDIELGKIVAIDGEFMGLDVKRDPLCLIQISTGNSDAHIVQLDRKKFVAPNLSKLLSNKNITKIFHYGRADLAHIKYYLKVDVENILDISMNVSSFLTRSTTQRSAPAHWTIANG